MECCTSSLIVTSLMVCYTSALNCNYTLLEMSLMNSKENKYELSRAFFPPVDNPPEFITVKYHFLELDQNQTWYWSVFTSGLIHPPEVLQYMSLFFSKPYAFYNGVVYLVLTDITSETANCPDDLIKMQLLTQRVSSVEIQRNLHLGVRSYFPP